MPKASKSKIFPTTKPSTPINPLLNEEEIVFQGIRTHNLKDIDLTLPKNKLITIT